MSGPTALFVGFAVMAVGGACLVGRSVGRPRAGLVAGGALLVFFTLLWTAMARWVLPYLA